MTDTDLDAPEIPMLIALLRMASLINRPMRDGVADPEGLSLNELRLLMALAGEGAAAGHDLAEIMGMQPMNVSRALATLSAMGLVEEIEDPANRRRKPFRLSAAGWARHAALTPELAIVARFLFDGMSMRDRAALAKLLARLNARLDDWRPGDPHRHVPRA